MTDNSNDAQRQHVDQLTEPRTSAEAKGRHAVVPGWMRDRGTDGRRLDPRADGRQDDPEEAPVGGGR